MAVAGPLRLLAPRKGVFMTNSSHPEAWQAWHHEQELFLMHNTEGFEKDLNALHYHIRVLTHLCPKDKAGWPTTTALSHLDELKRDYARFKSYLEANAP